MKITLIITLFIAPIICFGQSYKLHGTEIIAAIGTDGVMICADTRVTVADLTGHPMAYFDGLSKIHKIGNFAIGIQGISHGDRVNLISLMDEFGKNELNGVSIDQIPIKWYQFIDSHLSTTDAQDFSRNTYILIGYDKGKPRVIRFAIDNYNRQFMQEAEYFSADNETDPLFNYRPTYNCRKLLKMAKQAIYKYAIISHKQNSIGGPIAALIIKPTGEFIPNKYCDFKILTNDELGKELRSKKIRFHYLTLVGKRNLDSTYKLNDFSAK